MPARHIGRYQIVRELGRGSMGVVYLAVDPRIGRRVALKTVRRPDGLSAAEEARYRERFRREAIAAGKLSHPNIVTVHDVGDDPDTGASFLVMEHVEGATLRDRIQAEAPLPEGEVRRIGAQLAEALDFAHAGGVIHRDIKPANILLNGNGDAKIMDFGIARLGDSDVTREDQAIGSPAYMSPEQIRGERVDRRTDFFSLGVLLYQMATGHKPFDGRDTAAVMFRILNEDPLAPSQVPSRRRRRKEPGRPGPDLDRILLRLLRKRPGERYDSGSAIARDLRAPVLPATPPERRAAGARGSVRPAGRRNRPRAEILLATVGALLVGGLLLLGGLRTGRIPRPAGGAPAPGMGGWLGSTGPEEATAVEIVFPHHLPSGLLTVRSDGKEILSQGLESEPRSRPFLGRWRLERPAGLVRETVRVRAGRHRFEALVDCPEEGLSVRGEGEVEVPPGAAGRLRIDLDRWFGRRLRLDWE
ncbi:MAG: serine/threonine protein kinase [Acidobacteria bacterium]|nr:serine/threonine protein kinase [Acidobacteriota bacterium]